MEANGGLKSLCLILSRELTKVQSAAELSVVLCFTGMIDFINNIFCFNFLKLLA